MVNQKPATEIQCYAPVCRNHCTLFLLYRNTVFPTTSFNTLTEIAVTSQVNNVALTQQMQYKPFYVYIWCLFQPVCRLHELLHAHAQGFSVNFHLFLRTF